MTLENSNGQNTTRKKKEPECRPLTKHKQAHTVTFFYSFHKSSDLMLAILEFFFWINRIVGAVVFRATNTQHHREASTLLSAKLSLTRIFYRPRPTVSRIWVNPPSQTDI